MLQGVLSLQEVQAGSLLPGQQLQTTAGQAQPSGQASARTLTRFSEVELIVTAGSRGYCLRWRHLLITGQLLIRKAQSTTSHIQVLITFQKLL